jgi:hypothetical protein
MSDSAFDRAMADRWHIYKPPARPSAGDVAIYEEYMREPADMLLLGATSELRSLAHRYGHRLTAVDVDADVFHSLRRLVHPQGNEEFIACDWLDMALGRKFDLIAADGSLNMIPHDAHERFLERVADHLADSGRALLHVHVCGETRFASPREVVAWARTVDQDFYTATRKHLCMLWLDPATRTISNAECLNRFRDLHREGILRDEELAHLQKIFHGDSLVLHFVERKEFEALLGRNFEIEDIRFAGDYENHEMKPIYCLRKRV